MYITAQVILHNITFTAPLLASDYQRTSLKYTHLLIYGSFTKLLPKVNLIRAYYSPFCCAHFCMIFAPISFKNTPSSEHINAGFVNPSPAM